MILVYYNLFSVSGTVTKRNRTKKRNKRLTLLIKPKNQKCKLTPEGLRLYSAAKKIARKCRQYMKEVKTTKQKLKAAQSLSSMEHFSKLPLNKTTRNFFLMQLKLQKLKPKGRRFTLEDKLLSLVLYKQSPSAYRLWKKIFALPSKKTLTNLLRMVPMQSGINPHILNSLKTSVAKMEPENRKCVMMFDEMALEAGLSYDVSTDVIYGFRDTGMFKYTGKYIIFSHKTINAIFF